jgi:hypothetical protein
MKKLILVLLFTCASNIMLAQDIQELFTNVLSHYINVKNALVENDTVNVVQSAGDLISSVKNVSQNIQNNKNEWGGYAEKMITDAEKIQTQHDINEKREAFMSLSVTLYTALKSLKFNIADLYYQHCPAAMGKGAYWISETEPVRNPYGSKLQNCGVIKDVLKAKE